MKRFRPCYAVFMMKNLSKLICIYLNDGDGPRYMNTLAAGTTVPIQKAKRSAQTNVLNGKAVPGKVGGRGDRRP